jgi:hypothetical protein
MGKTPGDETAAGKPMLDGGREPARKAMPFVDSPATVFYSGNATEPIGDPTARKPAPPADSNQTCEFDSR